MRRTGEKWKTAGKWKMIGRGSAAGRNRLAAVFCAAAVVCAQGVSPAFAALKEPEYWKAATYYSDDWVANFWNSESVHMEEELARIAADGFNSIILAVPWKEFQPSVSPGAFAYEAYAYEKLDRVLRAAKEQGLWVFLRVGYTWDFGGGSMDADRYRELVSGGRAEEAWLDYAASLYEACSVHENFAGGFITWEDFWNFLQDVGNRKYRENSRALARQSGYQEFLEANWTLEELEERYGLEADSFEEIGLPERDDPLFWTFYQFYDVWLNQLLRKSQEVFPGLSMEVRLDVDPVNRLDGSLAGMSHSGTFSCGTAAYTAAMYSVSMGREAADGDMTAAEALAALERNLGDVLARNGGKPLFLEQFLFYDDTPEFSHNPKLLPEERTAFLRGAAPILASYSGGYGVWTYRDYRNNSVFNSQFGLGSRGWTFSGGAHIQEADGNHRASLPAGGKISQDLGARSRQGRTGGRTLEFSAESKEPVTLQVSFGGDTRFVSVEGAETVELNFSQDGEILAVASDGPVELDDFYFYNLESEGLLYRVDGTESELIGAVRALNGQLP